MSEDFSRQSITRKTLIKRCHICGHITESNEEIQRCPECHKCFLPLNYFNKVETVEFKKYEELFSTSDELLPEELIIGIHVIW